MNDILRLLGLISGASLVWLTLAAQLPSHVRLPVDDVVAGATVSQPFGCTNLQLELFDPYCPGRHFHSGVDLAAPVGAEVHAATAGRVGLGYDPALAGRYVVVTVDAHVRMLYCHLSEFRVRSGQWVDAGELIGLVGQTGLATGPHVHLEVQVDGLAVDPAAWLAS